MSPTLLTLLTRSVRWPVSASQPIIPTKATLDALRLDWLRYQAHRFGRELRQRREA